MKTILLLGGSAQQVVAITKSKELGYRTVLCDYLPDNPGKDVADVFYLVSTTDKEAILDVAQKERVDGVVAYASDPAALTAAYVASKLGLPSNPYESIEILSKKNLFRKYLSDHGFNVPQTYTFCFDDFNFLELSGFQFPVIVKPIDSSGSKGVTVVNNESNIINAIKLADQASRDKLIIIEEYIQMAHKYQIGGDIYVSREQINIWGLLNCHRNYQANPLVPIGKSYPLLLEEKKITNVKDELTRLIKSLNITFGPMNVEVIIDDKGQVYIIEVGPRNGGNMIPELLQYITGIDIVEMTLKSAMGESLKEVLCEYSNRCYATHNLHSITFGRFERIEFRKELLKYIIRKNIYKKKGDQFEYFENAAKALGIIFLEFEEQERQEYILNNISKLYKVVSE